MIIALWIVTGLLSIVGLGGATSMTVGWGEIGTANGLAVTGQNLFICGLIGLVVTSKDPNLFALPPVLFSYEPYGFMVRRNDAAFRLAVNRALAGLYRSGDVAAVYDRWFGAFGKPSQAIQAMYLLNGLPE